MRSMRILQTADNYRLSAIDYTTLGHIFQMYFLNCNHFIECTVNLLVSEDQVLLDFNTASEIHRDYLGGMDLARVNQLWNEGLLPPYDMGRGLLPGIRGHIDAPKCVFMGWPLALNAGPFFL